MATLKSATYTAPAYDEKKYRAGINTSYYDKAINNYKTSAEAQRKTQLGEAQKTQQAALKNAYVQRVQSERNLNNSLATAGIRGGATETSNLKLANTYAGAVGAANSDYSNSVQSINQAIDQNIRDYTNDMQSRAEEYRQNMAQAKWQAAREDALNKYNAAREDNLNRYNAAREDEARKYNAAREDKINDYNMRNEFWNNYYMDYYSGASKATVQKALKTATANYKKAKTVAQKQQILQQIRGIQNRLGVINNAKK